MSLRVFTYFFTTYLSTRSEVGQRLPRSESESGGYSTQTAILRFVKGTTCKIKDRTGKKHIERS